MASTLEQLSAVLGYPAGHACGDWRLVESVFGSRLPSDYRRYVDAFPNGRLNEGLVVLHPGKGRDAEEIREFAKGLSEHFACEFEDDGSFPFRFWPEPGGLIPWADWDMYFMAAWLPEGDDPDKWGVVLLSADGRWWQGSAGMLETLAAVVRGEDPSGGVVPQDLLSAAPRLTPYPYTGWRPDSPGLLVDYWTTLAAPLSEVADRTDVIAALVANSGGRYFDWAAIEDLGPFPADFKHLCERVGPGVLGPVRVMDPMEPEEGGLRRLRDDLLASARRDRGGVGIPDAPFWPEPGGAMAFAVTVTGAVCAWLPLSADPDRWPVIVIDNRWRAIRMFEFGATGLLLRCLEHPEPLLA